MPNIGITGIILVGILALLLFGPKKLPELGRAVGTTIREFRSGTRALVAEEEQAKSAEQVGEKKNES